MLPCLQNPTTHYYGGNAGNVISGNPLTWINKGATKSIYDPCPYGYRVPKDGSWAGLPGTKWTDGDIKGGRVWQSTWWPATGERAYNSAAMGYVANQAHYWSSSPYDTYRSCYLYFNYDGYASPGGTYDRSYGISLRCVQE